ncbi:MAG: MBL fold metallo-hydrolase [Prevotella sp.]|nr:MBL fold metallo-hydrolase [Prevotella sp.]MDE7455179.1 MBL fold metallo-hydrolase [Prevotella sp.]
MKLTFLGTGTSCGVPTIGCQCHTCTSGDPHDKRLRASALIETEGTRLLLDCGPDFRQQIMPLPFRRIDGILITHAHYDHMGGMDDIRPYCQFGEINVYADPIACQGMLQMLPYCFAEHRYPGVPAIQLHEIHPHKPFRIGDLDIVPFQVMHHDLPILGYRIGSLAYITDMKTINPSEVQYVTGCHTLVVNALRIKPHHSHQTLDEAVSFARLIGARQTWLIHSSHDMGRHAEVNAQLPPDIQLAYDGQVISIDD